MLHVIFLSNFLQLTTSLFILVRNYVQSCHLKVIQTSLLFFSRVVDNLILGKQLEFRKGATRACVCVHTGCVWANTIC